MVKRQKLSAEVEQKLERYYGGRRCVVTKNSVCEYHHIDDDASNTTFVNLLPLASDLNCPELRDAHVAAVKGRDFILLAVLQPEYLMHQADLHFANWDISLAYGCARLASFIGKNYYRSGAENYLRFACAAMYFARHTANYELIRDILEREFLPIVESGPISSRMRDLMFQELGGIHSEHGENRKSAQLYDLISNAVAKSDFYYTAGKKAALLRRKATADIAENGLTSLSSSLLEDAKNTHPNSENLTASIANTRAWDRLSVGDYLGAMEILENLYEIYK